MSNQVYTSFHNKELLKNPKIREAALHTETGVFIYNLNTDEYVKFMVVPDTLAENYKPTFHTESNIYGRSTPLYFYTGGGDKTLSFSFTLHEDLLPRYESRDQDTKTDIYKFLEQIQELAEAQIKNVGTDTQTLREPQVYLEIGNQFAGKGFVEILWNYKTPYRNEKYIVVDMTIKFTYVLDYETPTTELYAGGDEVLTQDFTFNLDIDAIKSASYYGVGGGKYLENFVPEYLDYEYIRSYVWETQKLYESYSFTALSMSDFEFQLQWSNLTFSAKSASLTVTMFGRFNNLGQNLGEFEKKTPFFLAALSTYYIEIVNILRPDISQVDRFRALNILRERVVNLSLFYNVTGGDINFRYSQQHEIHDTADSLRMTDSEKKLFEQEIDKLQRIITTQQAVLTQLVGGGQ